MKLLIVPDVHGRHSWQETVRAAIKRRDTHIIFIGDYVDSFDIPGFKILENLRAIINLKKKFPDSVTLLLGNHDYAYIHSFFAISGFSAAMFLDYKELFEKNKDLFELAWGFQGKEKYTLITHAGLTQSFYNVLQKRIEDKNDFMHSLLVKFPEDYDNWYEMPIHELLNYFKDQKDTMWYVSHYRGGTHNTSSILWTDKQELIKDKIPGIDQIVGHTNQEGITEIKQLEGDTLYFIDASTPTKLSLFSIELE